MDVVNSLPLLRVQPYAWESLDKIALARHFFELARGHPLSLTFDLEDFPDYHHARTIDNYNSKIADIRAIICSVLNDYAAQLARLELKGFGRTRGETSWAMWLSQLTRDKNPRQLKSLVISDAHSIWQPLDQCILYELEMPSLRNVSLSNLDMDKELLITPNILTRTIKVPESVEKDIHENELKSLFDMFDTRRLAWNCFEEEDELVSAIRALAADRLPSLAMLRLQYRFHYPGIGPKFLRNISHYKQKFYNALLSMVERRVHRVNNPMTEVFTFEAVDAV